MKRSQLPPTIRAFIDALSRPGRPDNLALWGRQTSTLLTDATDRITVPILESIDPSQVAVYALGGYGRRELAPFSDVDILIIMEGQADTSNATARLWDTGLNPSIIIREPDQIRTSAAGDLLFATSILDARWLCGRHNEEIENAGAWLKEAAPELRSKLIEDGRSRHKKHRGAGHQEPNIRDGRGGLRDLQAKRWIRMTTDGRRESSTDDGERLGTLLAARTIVHIVLGKREDRIPLTERAGIRDWLAWEDEDVFFRTVFQTMKSVTAGTSAPTAAGEGDPVSRLRGMLDRLADARPGSESCASELRRLDLSGVLAGILPEWARIDCLPREDAAHLYTPEEHTLRVIDHVERFFESPSAILDFSTITRKDIVVLAALFHDIGKGSGRDHHEQGAVVAEATLMRWGYAESDAELVAWLVRHHDILPHHAFRRDVDDPALIHSLAKIIGHVQKLKMLYILTVADLESVSGDLFNDWKANLLDKLAARLERQCRATLPPAQLAASILDRRRRAVAALMEKDGEGGEIDGHFAKIDARYALAHTPEQIALHIRVAPRLASENAVVERRYFPHHGYIEITVMTKSRTGIFASMAGTLSARDFNILEADVFTRDDGIAIDTFRVEDRAGLAHDEARLDKVADDLKLVLADEISAETLLRERRPYVECGAASDRRPPEIHFDNDSSLTHTVIEVVAADRMGLLHDIAAFFRDCKIGITSAIVSTASGLAFDVFYVTVGRGEKITEPAAIRAIRRGLLGRLLTHSEKVIT